MLWFFVWKRWEWNFSSWITNLHLEFFFTSNQEIYVCFSYVKEFWSRNGCTPLFAVDGTFTTTCIFKHTLLFAVSYDGNNQLVHFAYGVRDTENAENWKWYIGKLIDDFPGCTYICWYSWYSYMCELWLMTSERFTGRIRFRKASSQYMCME